MPIKLFLKSWVSLKNISGFGIIYKVRFEKGSLNAASYQTADSTVSVRTSKEPELKGLITTTQKFSISACAFFCLFVHFL